MKHRFIRLLALFCIVAAGSVLSFGQIQSTSPLTGTVVDANGAVVAGASVTASSAGTGQKFSATTNESGDFTIPALDNGLYTITVSASGFKTAVVKDVKVNVGTAANVRIQLAVGGASETIEVQGSGEVLQTQSAAVNNTITGRQLTELPFVSRNAMDLITNLPGTNTPGRTRSSSVNGLPKGSINITLDGVNVQDNLLKSNDGFFTIIQPRIDAVEEVSLSTATPGAESNAEGATQIKFATKSGTNDFHGGTYWYQKNRALDANTFTNKNNTPTLPKQPIILNEGGFKVGGPILKDRVFFFVNYEQYRFPNSQSRSRTILDPSTFTGSTAGNFVYIDSSGVTHTVNVLQLAANANAANGNNNFKTTIDPSVLNMLQTVQKATTGTGQIVANSNPLLQTFNFVNVLGDKRDFLDQRFDFQITSKLHVENTYHYDKFGSLHPQNFDNLNNRDPVFPGILPGTGSQSSDRYADSFGVRYTISNSMVNEARFGVQASRVRFFPEVAGNSSDYSAIDGGAFRLVPGLMTTPTLAPSNQFRNTPTTQFADNLSWTRGNHSMTYGFSYTRTSSYQDLFNNFVPTVNLGIDSNDPLVKAGGPLVLGNFPGASNTQLANAQQLYALLVGSVTSITSTAARKSDGTYTITGDLFEQARQQEFGFYGQDAYRIRPNLTLNYGLRYEVQLPYYNTNTLFTRVVGGVNGLEQASGSQVTPVTASTPSFNTDKNNFAPSFGLAWSPNFKAPGLLQHIFGEPGQLVVRGGYSIAYDREGVNNFYGIWGANPGANLNAAVTTSAGTLPVGTTLRGGLPALVTPSVSFPFTVGATDTLNDFDPNLTVGYVQSWSFGIQRELNKDTALEIRYVGNHGTSLWRQYGLNELNTVNNGFLNEFIAAQNNLKNNVAAGKGNTFANLAGVSGDVALPIFTASFGSATSSSFSSSTFLTPLNQNTVGAAANALASNATFQKNRIAAGLSPNFFFPNGSCFVNSAVASGLEPAGGCVFLTTNAGDSNYNSMVIEVRRRLSKGLLMNASYTWAHAISNGFASSSVSFYQPRTFSNEALDKGPTPWNIQNTFKANFIYELPFGPGRKWSFANGDVGTKIMNKMIEGWQTDGIMRIQSGTPFLLTSGRQSVNASDGGVVLHGVTVQQLQSMVGVYPTTLSNGTSAIYFLPPNLANNSAGAFGNGSFDPNSPYIGPPTTPGQFGSFVYLRGPGFWDVDLSVVKKTKITERFNIEARIEMTNAFNHVNWLVGSAANDLNTVGVNSATFGQTTNFFQDFTGTNDIGARMMRWVLRFNF